MKHLFLKQRRDWMYLFVVLSAVFIFSAKTAKALPPDGNFAVQWGELRAGSEGLDIDLRQPHAGLKYDPKNSTSWIWSNHLQYQYFWHAVNDIVAHTLFSNPGILMINYKDKPLFGVFYTAYSPNPSDLKVGKYTVRYRDIDIQDRWINMVTGPTMRSALFHIRMLYLNGIDFASDSMPAHLTEILETLETDDLLLENPLFTQASLIVRLRFVQALLKYAKRFNHLEMQDLALAAKRVAEGIDPVGKITTDDSQGLTPEIVEALRYFDQSNVQGFRHLSVLIERELLRLVRATGKSLSETPDLWNKIFVGAETFMSAFDSATDRANAMSLENKKASLLACLTLEMFSRAYTNITFANEAINFANSDKPFDADLLMAMPHVSPQIARHIAEFERGKFPAESGWGVLQPKSRFMK